MKVTRSALRGTGVVLLSGILLAGVAAAQDDSSYSGSGGTTSRSDWERRALRQPRTWRPEGMGANATYRGELQWASPRRGPIRTVSAELDQGAAVQSKPRPAAAPETVATPAPMAPVPMDGTPILEEGPGGPMMGMPGGGCNGFGDCGDGGMCGSCEGMEFEQGLSDCMGPWVRNLSVFAGVQGFKGAMDRGTNGNFGVHEGLNFGAPLGDPWGIGYQLGFQAVQSDFQGFYSTDDQGDLQFHDTCRGQIFITAGLFLRQIDHGFQGGVTFDYMHDNYYDNTHLKQIRSETSYLFNHGRQEVGYWGAYRLSSDRFSTNGYIWLEATDIFSLFYRHHFTGGGQGRLWIGGTGMGDGVIGGEATVPLGTSWALENSFTYMVPKHGNETGTKDETWAVSMSLVWYPGRSSRCVFKNPFTPILPVADNGTFLTRRADDARDRNN